MTSSSIVSRTEGRLVVMYLFAAVVYFVICFSGSMLVRSLKSRMST
jgi:glutamate/aspartate transport system permease protein